MKLITSIQERVDWLVDNQLLWMDNQGLWVDNQGLWVDTLEPLEGIRRRADNHPEQVDTPVRRGDNPPRTEVEDMRQGREGSQQPKVGTRQRDNSEVGRRQMEEQRGQ